MASFLQRLALPLLLASSGLFGRAPVQDLPFIPPVGMSPSKAARGARRIARSKHTVAQDRRAAAKARARKRAKRLGQA